MAVFGGEFASTRFVLTGNQIIGQVVALDGFFDVNKITALFVGWLHWLIFYMENKMSVTF